MKIQILSIVTILLVACGQKSQTGDNISTYNKASQTNLQTFSITDATASEFIKAKKIFVDKILYDTITYSKVNGEIKLPVDEKWRPFVTFRDTLVNTDDTDVRQYHYVGQFEKIGFYIVGGGFWEHSEYYLIDKRTGRQTTLWDSPAISPNDSFIANLSMIYGLEGVPNGIQIWQIQKQENNQFETISISKYLELDQQIWAPQDFIWETDNSLILKVASIDNYMNENGHPKESDYYYLRIKIQ